MTSVMQGLKLNKPVYNIKPIQDSKDLVIQSVFADLGSTTVREADMKQWPIEAVFCHNDLTPRNLIISSSNSPDGNRKYGLAGIIDWETAGFYPPSYELSLQDRYLSGGNRRLSFYLLLKQCMKVLVPFTPPQVALLQAMELIFESQQRHLSEGTNIPAHIRMRFRQLLRLSRDGDPYTGLTCEAGDGPLPEFSQIDAQRLEDDVNEEMIARRQASAK